MSHFKVSIVLLLGAGVIALHAQESQTSGSPVSQTNSFTCTNFAIPDGDPAGVTDVRNVTSGIAHITSLQVRLNISGDFNGDLYAYLQHGSGLTVLLNRTGKTATNPYGYDDCGFDVTFSDSAANDIHSYRVFTTPPRGSPLTGAWQPDARFIDPTAVTDASLRSTFLSEFDGLHPQGDWVLFLAGMDYGGTNTLNSWALEITGTPPIPPSITWANPPAITYGAALSAAQLNATANVPGSFSYSPPAGTVLAAGLGQGLSVTFVPNDTNDYATATAVVPLDVLRQSLAVTTDAATRVYGAANPPLTGSVVGLTNGDDITVLFTTAADATSPVGSYPILPVLQAPNSVLGNYSVITNSGMLYVAPAPLAVLAQNQSQAYGAANPLLTWTAAGFVNGDTQNSALTGSPILSTSATPASPLGAYPITIAPGNLAAANYTFTFVNAALTVTPAVLICQANNTSRPYGETNPVFTASYSGFVNGDNASIVSGPLSGSSPAQTNSPVGSYPISVSGQSAPNYSIQYVAGTLTVGPAPLVVQANDAGRAYGRTNPIFSASFVGLTNGDAPSALEGTLVFTTTAETNSPVGSYPIVPSGLSSTNYSLTYSNGTLSVGAYALVVTADNQARSYGAPNPPLTGTVAGLQNGDNITATYSTDADTIRPVGN
jgi:subtilisin-like proprotein convertase family protein